MASKLGLSSLNVLMSILLYYKDDEMEVECKFCRAYRFKPQSKNDTNKKNSYNFIVYLSLISHLKSYKYLCILL